MHEFLRLVPHSPIATRALSPSSSATPVRIGRQSAGGFGLALVHPIRPKDHIDILRPLLPAKYSALQQSGNGLQSVYLTEVPDLMAEAIIGLIGAEATMIAGRGVATSTDAIPQSQNADLEVWEHHIEDPIEADPRIPETDRESLIVARRGQGLFKQRVMQI